MRARVQATVPDPHPTLWMVRRSILPLAEELLHVLLDEHGAAVHVGEGGQGVALVEVDAEDGADAGEAARVADHFRVLATEDLEAEGVIPVLLAGRRPLPQ